jgi:hypothetical protein
LEVLGFDLDSDPDPKLTGDKSFGSATLQARDNNSLPKVIPRGTVVANCITFTVARDVQLTSRVFCFKISWPLFSSFEYVPIMF